MFFGFMWSGGILYALAQTVRLTQKEISPPQDIEVDRIESLQLLRPLQNRPLQGRLRYIPYYELCPVSSLLAWLTIWERDEVVLSSSSNMVLLRLAAFS